MTPTAAPILGQIPPPDACSVRLRLRLKRKGNPPAVVVHTLTEHALLAAIQQSESFRTWLIRDDGGYPSPSSARRLCPGDLTWLDSAQRELDVPAEVVFPYEPPLRPPCGHSLCALSLSAKETPMSPATSLAPSSPPPVEPVPFLGGVLSALRSDGHGWLLLKPACEALGIDPEAQRQRLARTPWAQSQTCITQVWEGNLKREVYCLRADRVAMWLATLDTSRIADEQARQRLALWQCHAADALDRWWRSASPAAGSSEAIEQQVARLVGLLLPPLVAALRPPPRRRLSVADLLVQTRSELLDALLRWCKRRDQFTFMTSDLLASLSDDGSDPERLRELFLEFCGAVPKTAHVLGNALRRLRVAPRGAGAYLDVLPDRTAEGRRYRLFGPL
jgi:hypothetical protein